MVVANLSVKSIAVERKYSTKYSQWLINEDYLIPFIEPTNRCGVTHFFVAGWAEGWTLRQQLHKTPDFKTCNSFGQELQIAKDFEKHQRQTLIKASKMTTRTSRGMPIYHGEVFPALSRSNLDEALPELRPSDFVKMIDTTTIPEARLKMYFMIKFVYFVSNICVRNKLVV